MKLKHRIISLTASAAISFGSFQLTAPMENVSAAGADTFSFPVQEFRLGIGDTDRSITLSGNDKGDYLSSNTFSGKRSQKFYLNYISKGVYEIASSETGYVITDDNGVAVIQPDTDADNQRWNIESVEKDFEGYALYYRITSIADSSAALTFEPESNSIAVESYKADIYQKYRLNLDGLEGFAAESYINGKMKAGTVGGLLGETVFCDSVEKVVAALDSNEPKTVVVTKDLDFVKQSKEKQRIRDDKTLVGSYAANTITDSLLRNDDFWGKDDRPSQNIVIRNVHFNGKYLNSNGSGQLFLQFYGVRNLWLDHNSFSAEFAQDKDNEVGKFVWINTPSESWSDGVYNAYNPDYITASYNSFLNRYWTFAFGSQNKDTSRLHTTLMFNKWEQCSRRCPQYSNGYDHNYNNYHTVSNGGNPNKSSQVIGGEGSRVINENCLFEGYIGNELDPDRNSCLSFTDSGSYTANSPSSAPSPISFRNHNTNSWNAEECYGYHLIAAYNGKKDLKSFCNSYSGAWDSFSRIKYITDAECAEYVQKTISQPNLKHIEVGDAPVYGKNGAVMDTEKTYTIRNVNSGLYLANGGASAEAGLDLTQNTDPDGWKLEDAGNGYYRIYSQSGNGKPYLLNISAGSKDNGTSAEIWTEAGTDSQLFKFVPNADGSYTITTMVTKDRSALGVVAASKDVGAAVVQWECNESNDQKWYVEVKTENIIGDVNSDGSFNIADVVAMQNWLLSKPNAVLVNWKAGDLCEDNKLNVFDFILMKKLLLAGRQPV